MSIDNLEKKLARINNPRIPKLQHSKVKITIEEYYNKFIEPYLPNVTQTIKWHKILKDYVKKDGAVLAFRTGNVEGKLRRGWETVVINDNYRFIYADNFFAHYFFKLAHDTDYKVTGADFYKLMKNKKFPVRFIYYMDKDEHDGASFNVDAKNPGIGISGYKLAHIIDAGKNYYMNGNCLSITDIVEKYFSLGDDKDWNQISADKKPYREIKIADTKTARKYAEMSFLRMVHPMNYFLSPKAPNNGVFYNIYSINGSEEKKDIGENANLISYVRQRFLDRYRIGKFNYFQEFLDLVNPEEDSIQEDGNSIIDIEFDSNPLTLPTKERGFIDFLKKNTNGCQTPNTYARWMKKLKAKVSKDLYDIEDKKEVKEIMKLFNKGGSYYEYNRKENGYPSAVIRKYFEYLEEKEKNNTDSIY